MFFRSKTLYNGDEQEETILVIPAPCKFHREYGIWGQKVLTFAVCFDPTHGSRDTAHAHPKSGRGQTISSQNAET